MHSYRHSEGAQGSRFALGVVFLLVALGVTWLAVTSQDPIVIRLLYIVFALTAGVNALRIGLMVIFSNPTLTIDNEGVMAGGWWPSNALGNWARQLRWSEISQAKVVTKEHEIAPGKTKDIVCLMFYSKEEPDKILAEVTNFDKFEKTGEIVRKISEQLGQPVLEEGLQEKEVALAERTQERDTQIEKSLSKADLEARIAAGLCPKCGNKVASTDQNCPTCHINLEYARRNLDQLLR